MGRVETLMQSFSIVDHCIRDSQTSQFRRYKHQNNILLPPCKPFFKYRNVKRVIFVPKHIPGKVLSNVQLRSLT